MTTIDTLRWRIRVWAWRLGLPVLVALAMPACELRQIKRDCIREIAAARTELEVDMLERVCHLQIERR